MRFQVIYMYLLKATLSVCFFHKNNYQDVKIHLFSIPLASTNMVVGNKTIRSNNYN